MPHVATLNGGKFEELDATAPLNVSELVQGLAELNRNGIVLLDIRTGASLEGVTKISGDALEQAGLYLNGEWIVEPKIYDETVDLPEVNVVPFKSDSWVLGEYIVRHKTGKTIPKRFLKSQSLLDKFIEDDEILKKLLIIDPSNRSYAWEVAGTATQNEKCSVM